VGDLLGGVKNRLNPRGNILDGCGQGKEDGIMIITAGWWRKPKIPAEVSVIPLMAATMLGVDHTVLAYTQGTIAAKADPIIQMIRELADPVAYCVFLWACLRFIMHQAPEAKSMMKDCAWGYFLVQMAPVFMGMIRDVK